MSDPERLLSESGALGATLLRAGLEEQPSPRSVERTLAAVASGVATLGVAGAVGAATSGAAGTAATVGVASVVKLLAIGAVTGVVASGAVWGVSSTLGARKPPERPVPSAPARAPVQANELAPPAPPVVAPPPSAIPLEAPRAPHASSASFEPPDGAPLAAEVVLVDWAHAALKAGNPTAALAALAPYERQFEAPRLLPEVFALRMEAAERLADLPSARLWAGRILSRFPRSAQAARARGVLDGQTGSSP